jgi:hypothetical protein
MSAVKPAALAITLSPASMSGGPGVHACVSIQKSPFPSA